ncbi:hypothetical protein E2C01_062943 [Portunus trituberculatus]|uniref:Uncharacterized protein n=1 Tax=Portunus trituberculatus TaxID=210409 RepID=A0A5B7HFF4_PORTR|nr:hypothetical protein [Portunus trituberculatus]
MIQLQFDQHMNSAHWLNWPLFFLRLSIRGRSAQPVTITQARARNYLSATDAPTLPAAHPNPFSPATQHHSLQREKEQYKSHSHCLCRATH